LTLTSPQSRTFMDATCITLWLKTIKRLTLIKLILEESNKITLGPNQNQLNTTLYTLPQSRTFMDAASGTLWLKTNQKTNFN
jgi:hypothetical protein